MSAFGKIGIHPWLMFWGLVLPLVFGIYWFHIRLLPEDAARYTALMEESTTLRTRHALTDAPAHQKREGVQKDLWTQNETRHFQIASKASELAVSQVKGQTEAVERLEEIRCVLDNEITLTAAQGIYTYPSHRLIAQNDCRLVQGDNQIEGTRLEFDPAQETATYENPRGSIPSIPLQFSAKQLIWDKKENTLHLSQNVRIEQPTQFCALADVGIVELNQLQPTLITLEGNVRLVSSRLQDKESFAAADTLEYDPIRKTLLFSSLKKVLFWQEDLCLSASEVLIREDQSVEGRGDVHFSFNLDEQNFIHQFFQKYL